MRRWPVAAASMLALAVTAAACRNPLGRLYEYEEDMVIGVDGAATITVTSSIPALVALRHVPLDPSPLARVDPDKVRAIFSGGSCGTARVGVPWLRDGRHFVQIQVTTADISTLSSCPPFGWSAYRLVRDGNELHFTQIVGPPEAGDPGHVNWDGSELVLFRLHVPSKIVSHNVRVLAAGGADGGPGTVDRGNILSWEQRLSDRRSGQPMTLDVLMQPESILYRTLWLFLGAFVAAVATLAGVIWLIVRRAKKAPLEARVNSRRRA